MYVPVQNVEPAKFANFGARFLTFSTRLFWCSDFYPKYYILICDIIRIFFWANLFTVKYFGVTILGFYPHIMSKRGLSGTKENGCQLLFLLVHILLLFWLESFNLIGWSFSDFSEFQNAFLHNLAKNDYATTPPLFLSLFCLSVCLSVSLSLTIVSTYLACN